MTEQRRPVEFEVDGRTITALTDGPTQGTGTGRPLIAALHGGTYSARYFDVAGSAHPTFIDAAALAGYPVVAFDRPGYGGSTAIAPAENTFELHARLLAEAIAQAARQAGADSVFIVGHSIGGMISAMIAAGEKDFRLIGASLTGMGAVLRRDGAAQALAALPEDATVDLPVEGRDQVMFGPAFTHTPEGVAAAHTSYAPVPVRELVQAPAWPEEHLHRVAPEIRVPVHHAVAEYDALWDSEPASAEQFAKLLTGAPYVDSGIARSTGHSIDHHTLGYALHLRQIAFAEECTLWAGQQNS